MKFMLKQAVLTIAAFFLAAVNTEAQVFGVLHRFTTGDNSTPAGGVILSGNTVYGTVPGGGAGNAGLVFSVNTDGTSFSNLYSFTATSTNSLGISTNSDGANPEAGLVLSGDSLYGTASLGGSAGSGTVFRVNTDGTDFTNLYNFSADSLDASSGRLTNSDGADPWAPLILSGNTLYGTTTRGGTNGQGTVFRVNTDGTCFTNLCSSYGFMGYSPVLLSGNVLYWTGSGGCYAVNTDGTSFTNFLHFTNVSEGIDPQVGLVMSGNVLYGTTSFGGIGNNGTVFRVNTDGTCFTNLHLFTGGNDGGEPQTGLVLSGDKLHGATLNNGGIFGINTDGTCFTNVFPDPYADGFSTMVLSGNTLYGAMSGMSGMVFALSLGPIPLNVQMNGSAVVLTWGNPAFWLQAAPTVSGVYTNIPDATSPYTNALAEPQVFFRLEAN